MSVRRNKRKSRGQKSWTARMLNRPVRSRPKPRPRRSKRKSFLQEAFAIAFVAWLAFQAVFSQVQPLIVSENPAPAETATLNALLNSGLPTNIATGPSQAGFLGAESSYRPNVFAPNSAYSNAQPIKIPNSSQYQASSPVANHAAVPASYWSYNHNR